MLELFGAFWGLRSILELSGAGAFTFLGLLKTPAPEFTRAPKLEIAPALESELKKSKHQLRPGAVL